MRDLFPGYYKLTKEELDRLWQECIFVFDANVLLNIYRVSKPTRDAFINVLQSLKERVWLPYQAAFEYQENRLNVLTSQLKAYEEIPKILNSSLSEIKSSYPRHPFIDVTQIASELNIAISKTSALLERAKLMHPDLTESDDLRDTLTEIFTGKVGANYEGELLANIYKEGGKRFEKQIPPGYKDARKEGDKKYGDFVLWNQIKDYAQQVNRPIILVSDDRKEDWWQEHKGKTIGPRPELIQEMKLDTGTSFYMYQSDRFIEYAQLYLGIIEEGAVKELREVLHDPFLQDVDSELREEDIYYTARFKGDEVLARVFGSRFPEGSMWVWKGPDEQGFVEVDISHPTARIENLFVAIARNVGIDLSQFFVVQRVTGSAKVRLRGR
jgi:hypothetical protein